MIADKESKEKEKKYVQIPRDQIQNAEQAIEIFGKHWLKKERVKIEESL